MVTASRTAVTSTMVTFAAYLAVASVIVLAWLVRDEKLIRADVGLGYWLGILGGSLMLLLLVYPLRKRVRALSPLGSVRFWFRTHMIFGILGPVLVLLHSNFTLGSVNGRIALFCTLVVASSGILGRYLYSRIHYGMYGQKATLASLQADMASGTRGRGLPIVSLIDERLSPYEQKALNRSRRLIPSVIGIVTAPFVVRALKRRLGREVNAVIDAQVKSTPTLRHHRERLRETARDYLAKRLATYRKFAQLRGFERLFSLWHIVHFPLFLVMVIAAIIHVVAVHAY